MKTERQWASIECNWRAANENWIEWRGKKIVAGLGFVCSLRIKSNEIWKISYSKQTTVWTCDFATLVVIVRVQIERLICSSKEKRGLDLLSKSIYTALLAKCACGDADRNRTRFFFLLSLRCQVLQQTKSNHVPHCESILFENKQEHNCTPAMSCEVAFTPISFLTQQSRNYHNAKHRISFFTPTTDLVIITCVSIVTHILYSETIILLSNSPFINKQTQFTSTGTRDPGDSMTQIRSRKSSLTGSNRYIWRLELKWGSFAP